MRAVPGFVADFVGARTPDNGRPDQTAKPGLGVGRQYFNGFERLADFSQFYIVPQNHMNSATHDLSSACRKFGVSGHKASIYAANPAVPGQNVNHRAYPAFRFDRTPLGIVTGAVLVELWVWADFQLARAADLNWISLATFSNYNDQYWYRSYLVNVNADGMVHLMHVPNNTQSAPDIFQTTSIAFPMRQWVKMDVYIDNSAANRFRAPFIAVWQDGQLVSASRFNGRLNMQIDLTAHTGFDLPACLKGVTTDTPVHAVEAACGLHYTGGLAQAHFGLYAPPKMSSGTICNDDLTVSEIVPR